jgi:hypothetical protein
MQEWDFGAPLTVTVRARTLEEAEALAGSAVDALASYVEFIHAGDIVIGELDLENTTDFLVKLEGANKDTVFPSAKALLQAGWSCKSAGGQKWSAYFMEFGCELTLFPGDEGPQEMADIDELIDAIGGDQPAKLTRASLKRLGVE